MKWIGKHREIEFLAIASNSLLNLIYPNNLSRKQKLLNFKVEAALKIGIQPTKEQISISLSSISIKSTWAKSHWKTNRRHRLASTRWQNLKSSHEKKAHLSDIILNTKLCMQCHTAASQSGIGFSFINCLSLESQYILLFFALAACLKIEMETNWNIISRTLLRRKKACKI